MNNYYKKAQIFCEDRKINNKQIAPISKKINLSNRNIWRLEDT